MSTHSVPTLVKAMPAAIRPWPSIPGLNQKPSNRRPEPLRSLRMTLEAAACLKPTKLRVPLNVTTAAVAAAAATATSTTATHSSTSTTTTTTTTPTITTATAYCCYCCEALCRLSSHDKFLADLGSNRRCLDWGSRFAVSARVYGLTA